MPDDEKREDFSNLFEAQMDVAGRIPLAVSYMEQALNDGNFETKTPDLEGVKLTLPVNGLPLNDHQNLKKILEDHFQSISSFQEEGARRSWCSARPGNIKNINDKVIDIVKKQTKDINNFLPYIWIGGVIPTIDSYLGYLGRYMISKNTRKTILDDLLKRFKKIYTEKKDALFIIHHSIAALYSVYIMSDKTICINPTEILEIIEDKEDHAIFNKELKNYNKEFLEALTVCTNTLLQETKAYAQKYPGLLGIRLSWNHRKFWPKMFKKALETYSLQSTLAILAHRPPISLWSENSTFTTMIDNLEWKNLNKIPEDDPRLKQGSGWKIHVAANSLNEKKVASIVVPYLFEKNIQHKILSEAGILKEWIETQDIQRGKFITIYLYDYNLAKEVAQDLDNLLEPLKNDIPLKSNESPPNDATLGKSGFVFCRYGNYSGSKNDVTKVVGKEARDKKYVWDSRQYPFPNFIFKPQAEEEMKRRISGNDSEPFPGLDMQWTVPGTDYTVRWGDFEKTHSWSGVIDDLKKLGPSEELKLIIRDLELGYQHDEEHPIK